MKTVSDYYAEEAKRSLEEAFERYKYWLQNGAGAYDKHFERIDSQDDTDWRRNIEPFCEYHPEKKLSVLSDPKLEALRDERRFCFLNDEQIQVFHELSHSFCEGDLPIEVVVEKGRNVCCRDPIEWFLYLCRLADVRREKKGLFTEKESRLWFEMIWAVWERVANDRVQNDQAKEEYERNKDFIDSWRKSITEMRTSEKARERYWLREPVYENVGPNLELRQGAERRVLGEKDLKELFGELGRKRLNLEGMRRADLQFAEAYLKAYPDGEYAAQARKVQNHPCIDADSGGVYERQVSYEFGEDGIVQLLSAVYTCPHFGCMYRSSSGGICPNPHTKLIDNEISEIPKEHRRQMMGESAKREERVSLSPRRQEQGRDESKMHAAADIQDGWHVIEVRLFLSALQMAYNDKGLIRRSYRNQFKTGGKLHGKAQRFTELSNFLKKYVAIGPELRRDLVDKCTGDGKTPSTKRADILSKLERAYSKDAFGNFYRENNPITSK
jgi:hypothetical protein